MNYQRRRRYTTHHRFSVNKAADPSGTRLNIETVLKRTLVVASDAVNTSRISSGSCIRGKSEVDTEHVSLHSLEFMRFGILVSSPCKTLRWSPGLSLEGVVMALGPLPRLVRRLKMIHLGVLPPKQPNEHLMLCGNLLRLSSQCGFSSSFFW
ncbi:hypothetical protein HZ326_0942 [Fusarium oxysporum f. sp. albedinis]|nr:hypothetical protein HZ326_0942 [Fusarium oxysporum f. sp. albedinis]